MGRDERPMEWHLNLPEKTTAAALSSGDKAVPGALREEFENTEALPEEAGVPEGTVMCN